MTSRAGAPGFWLLKTEPETYSFETLLKERRTDWNGVRNPQARNFLRQARVGDLAVIYHSGKERSAVGVARVVREAFPDPDSRKPGDWLQIGLEAVARIPTPVPLSRIKQESGLKDLLLIRQSRLSCMPMTPAEYKILVALGDSA